MAIRPLIVTLAASSALAGAAAAQQTACDSISLSDVGWTDITVTTSAAKQVFDALGYDVEVDVLSVPVTFASLAQNDLDAFFGNWMPSQQSAIQPYLDEGTIETVATNLEGTKYNLAVPTYTYEKGLQSYDDLPEFAEALDSTIYGIEPGNEGNSFLIGLIEEDAHGMGGFTVRESSEQGMLAQARRFYDEGEDVVFLGWEPHPMNATFDISYLEGGQEFFGGEGNVHTVTRAGFVEECPNAGQLLQNMTFTLPMENEIMGKILDDGIEADAAVAEWIGAHPEILDGWLEGVTTTAGEPGLPAVQEAFGV